MRLGPAGKTLVKKGFYGFRSLVCAFHYLLCRDLVTVVVSLKNFGALTCLAYWLLV